MIKAAIFDMDGLLIDSEPLWHASHIETVAEAGHTITTDDVRAMAGRRSDDVVRHWHDRFPIAQTPAATESKIVDRLIKRVQREGVALAGVDHVLHIFKAHDVPMVVASSSSPEVIKVTLNKLGIAETFRFTYSAKHEPLGKPHPGIFLTVAKKLGVQPGECVVFEDSVSGVQAALSAGMKVVAVPEPTHRTHQTIVSADLVVGSLEDITWDNILKLGTNR